MTTTAPVTRQHGNAYNIFILVLTVLSLVVMGCLLLPVNEATRTALNVWDNLICFIFLGDFAYNITGSRPRRQYFLHQRGWLDLLGSIPTLGLIPLAALFRLARLSRLGRIMRLLGGQGQKQLVEDVVRNRGQYALFITMLLAIVVMSVSSVLILQFEVGSPDANITTGGAALWWAVVTITTVGYGDYYPVTTLGRLVAVFVMFSGIGIIGALASILAALLVSPAPPTSDETAESTDTRAAESATASAPDAAELARTRAELERSRVTMDHALAEIADLRRLLEAAGTPGESGAETAAA
jgi:voltage-gated potassium channel